MEEEIMQYTRLKAEVVKLVDGNFSLEQIKECFASYINSKRALSRARSLAHVIRLLEERDVLNSRKVSCLHYLGQQLCNDHIKRTVHFYRKLFLEGSYDSCCICGLIFCQQQETAPLTELNQTQYPSSNNNRPNNGVIEAIRNVSLNIGSEWPVLALYLEIRQREIDDILSHYPNDTVEQAYQAMCIWLRRNQENATIQKLEESLNQRHCRRKGIGSHLLQPVIGLT